MAGSQQLYCTHGCMEGKRGNFSHPTLVVRVVLPPVCACSLSTDRSKFPKQHCTEGLSRGEK